MGERYIKNTQGAHRGYRSLNARQHQTIALIELLSREQNIVKQLCHLFEIPLRGDQGMQL